MNQLAYSDESSHDGLVTNLGACPEVVDKDFFPQFAYDHVQSLDGIADTIKSWIDNIDDAELLKALLKEVTGATDVVILDNGNKIAFNTP